MRIKIHFRSFALKRRLGATLDNCAVEVDPYFLDEIFAPEKRFKKGCLASLLRERILQYGHSNQTSYSALNTLRGCYIENGFCGFS